MAGSPTYSKNLFYDLGSRILFVSDPTLALGYNFDTAGRQILTAGYFQSAPAAGFGYFTGMAYDNDGNTTQLTYPDGYIETFGYDSFDELESVVENGPGLQTGVVLYQWTGLQQVSSASLANRASMTFSYDYYNNPQQITHGFFGGTSVTTTYQRDNDERRQQDAVSNGSYVWHPAASATTPYQANNLNQYTSINGAPLSYANPGNAGLLTDPTAPLGSTTYTWDIFNRLTGAKNSQHTATYGYDPMSRRVSKTVDGVTTLFVNDGNRVIAEYNYSGTTATETRHYVYGVGNAPLMQDNFGANGSISGSYFLHPDALGTIQAISDANGNPTPLPTSPWGEVSSTTGTPFRFAGMYLDPETLLYYDNARYYSPQQGRFISPDPIGLKGGMNIYAYSENDPVNALDVTGLDYNSSDCYSNCNDGSSGSSSDSPTIGPLGQSVDTGIPAGDEAPGDIMMDPITVTDPSMDSGTGGFTITNIDYDDPPSTESAPYQIAANGPPPGVPNPNGIIEGGPWKWADNPQNPRRGNFQGPRPPGGGTRITCTYACPGRINPKPYWKVNFPPSMGGGIQHYDVYGNKITSDQAHPGPPQITIEPGGESPIPYIRWTNPFGLFFGVLFYSSPAR